MRVKLQVLMTTMNREPPWTLRDQQSAASASFGEDAPRAPLLTGHASNPEIELRDFNIGGMWTAGWESVASNPLHYDATSSSRHWNSGTPMRFDGGAWQPALPPQLASLQPAPPPESSQVQQLWQPSGAPTLRNIQTAQDFHNFLMTSVAASSFSHDHQWMESTNSLHAHDNAGEGTGPELLPSTLTDSSNMLPSRGRSVVSIGDRGPLDTLSTLLMLSEDHPVGEDTFGLDSALVRSGRFLIRESTGNDSTWMMGSRGSTGRHAGDANRLGAGQYSHLKGQYSNLTNSGSYTASAFPAAAGAAGVAAAASTDRLGPDAGCDWRTYGGRRPSNDPNSGEHGFMGGGDGYASAHVDRVAETHRGGTSNLAGHDDRYDRALLSNSNRGARPAATQSNGPSIKGDNDDGHGLRSDGAAPGSSDRAPDSRWLQTDAADAAAQQHARGGGQASVSDTSLKGRRPPVRNTSSLGILAHLMNSRAMSTHKSTAEFNKADEDAARLKASQQPRHEEGQQAQPALKSQMSNDRLPDSRMLGNFVPDSRMPSGCRLVMMGADGRLVKVTAASTESDRLDMVQPGVGAGPVWHTPYSQFGPLPSTRRCLVAVSAAGQLVSLAGPGAHARLAQPHASHDGRPGGAGGGLSSLVQWPFDLGFGMMGANGSMAWQDTSSSWSTSHALLAGFVAVAFLINAAALMYLFFMRSLMEDMQQWAQAGIRK